MGLRFRLELLSGLGGRVRGLALGAGKPLRYLPLSAQTWGKTGAADYATIGALIISSTILGVPYYILV